MKGITLIILVVASFAQSQALDCGDGKIRGLNLGGWLLLEPWITPVVFEEVNVGDNEGLVVDEWTYAQYVDPAYSEQKHDSHWDTYITKSDLQTVADAGINQLRIPVPYWMVDVEAGEPFPPPPANDDEGSRFYLKRLIGWCEEIGIRFLLDLHGCPGSQNGFDNSGRRGDQHWFNETNSYNMDRTLVVLEKFADLMLAWQADGTMSSSTLYGIELANEPRGWEQPLWDEVRDHFFYDGYDVLRPKFPDGETRVSIQQCFRNSSEFFGYMSEEDGYTGVALDMHVYHGFGSYWNSVTELPDAWQIHLDGACDYAGEVAQQTLETFTGEWSLAITDCQKYVDSGYNDPYIPPNSNAETCEYYNSDWDSYDINYRTFLGDLAMAQMDSYEVGKGWYFWTIKTENNCAPEWDFMFLLEQGIMPANLCERPSYCNAK